MMIHLVKIGFGYGSAFRFALNPWIALETSCQNNLFYLFICYKFEIEQSGPQLGRHFIDRRRLWIDL